MHSITEFLDDIHYKFLFQKNETVYRKIKYNIGRVPSAIFGKSGNTIYIPKLDAELHLETTPLSHDCP